MIVADKVVACGTPNGLCRHTVAVISWMNTGSLVEIVMERSSQLKGTTLELLVNEELLVPKPIKLN